MRMILLLGLVIVLSSCESSSGERRRSRTIEREDGAHYFKSAERVDNIDKGPGYVYRLENDEVICYQRESGLWCRWKGIAQ